MSHFSFVISFNIINKVAKNVIQKCVRDKEKMHERCNKNFLEKFDFVSFCYHINHKILLILISITLRRIIIKSYPWHCLIQIFFYI